MNSDGRKVILKSLSDSPETATAGLSSASGHVLFCSGGGKATYSRVDEKEAPGR